MAGRIILVRHAHTAFNDDKGFPETTRAWLEVGLTEEGRVEADSIGRELATENVARVFCSSLTRAIETAQAIAYRVDCELVEIDDLRTWNIGDLGNRPIAQAMPEMRRLIEHEDESPETIEPFRLFRERVLKWFAATMDAARESGDTYVVVTHGRVVQLFDGWRELGYPSDFRANVEQMLDQYNSPTEPGQLYGVVDCAKELPTLRGTTDAAIVIVLDPDGKVLTVSRPEPPHEQAIPGGTVEDGETPEKAAIRELYEECGIGLDRLTAVAILTSPTDARKVHVFQTSAWSGHPYPSETGTRLAWLSPSQLLKQSRRFRSSVQELLDAGHLTVRVSATDRVLLDLGIADVHTPSASWHGTPQEKTMAEVSTKTRNALPAGKFALPGKRKYPIHDAAHVRNAAARLTQAKKKGTISDAEYQTARAAIVSAGKKYGIDSELTASEKPPTQTVLPGIARPKRFHVQADIAHGGSLHIRHMSDGVDRTFFAESGITLADAPDEDAKPVWIQLAKSGAFAGHPAGPFELSETVFQQIVANFKATKNQAIPIDYEHASEADPTSGNIPVHGAPAQGWVRDLKIDGGNLFGLVEWGPQARAQIRAGQYKFISPAIRFGAKDRVTGQAIGARLTSAGLTNEPFLDGMQPLAARDTGASEPQTGKKQWTAANPAAGVGAPLEPPANEPFDKLPAIRAALRLHDLADARECADMLDALRCKVAACGDASGSYQGTDLGGYTRELRKLVDGGDKAPWELVFDSIEDLIQSAIADDHDYTLGDAGQETDMSDADKQTLALKDTEIGALKVQLSERDAKIVAQDAELKTLREDKARRDEADITRDVEEAIATYGATKNLSAKDKPHLLAMAKGNLEAFRSMYPPVTAEQRYLLSQKAPLERRPDAYTLDATGKPLTTSALVSKLMTDRKLSYADAQNEAALLLNPSLRRR